MFINLGIGTNGPDDGPLNMSNIMVPQFVIQASSSNRPYSSTVCLPQVPLPVNTSFEAGTYATIQVVQLPVHGAAQYSVGLSDI